MPQSLGRGLSSLISQGVTEGNHSALSHSGDDETVLPVSSLGKIVHIAPGDIVPNPHQPRKNFSEESLEELKNSIAEHGILQPLVVTKNRLGAYELVAGERRLRAAQALHFKTVPAIERSISELEKLELSLIENIQRKDLNPIERACAYKKLIDEFSLTHEQAAKRMGKSRPVISNHLRLLELPEEVQQLVALERLSETNALAVLQVSDIHEQKKLAFQMVEQQLTRREVGQLVRRTGIKKRIAERGKKDPILKSYEERLQSALHTRVKVGRQGKTGWVIYIEAYSKDELRTLVDTITREL